MKVQNIRRLETKIKALAKMGSGGNYVGLVGYTQDYAVRVHEDLNMRHAKGTQAKFLEQPARELAPELSDIIEETYLKTKRMDTAIHTACLRLLRASQLIVPVDTGALRASGFARVDREKG